MGSLRSRRGVASLAQPASPHAIMTRMAGERILVVEDEPAVRELVRRVLEAEGYTLLIASQPLEAEALFDEHGGNIDLLLTDVVLPNGDGPDLYRRLSEKKPVRVLYMSGYVHTLNQRRHLLEGNPDFIAKPFTPDALAQKVREALALSLKDEQPDQSTVLVVDDQEPVRTVVKRTLEKAGYSVLLAANAAEAETIFDQRQGRIALLLCDVVLPGADGPDLYQRLSEKHPVKVLYMSGYTHTVGERRHLLQGNPDFLPKPFTPEELAAKVKKMIKPRSV